MQFARVTLTKRTQCTLNVGFREVSRAQCCFSVLNRWRQQKVSPTWPGRFSRLLPRPTSWACWRCAWCCSSSWACCAAASPSAWRRSWRTGREGVQGGGRVFPLPLQGEQPIAPHTRHSPSWAGEGHWGCWSKLDGGGRVFRLVLCVHFRGATDGHIGTQF